MKNTLQTERLWAACIIAAYCFVAGMFAPFCACAARPALELTAEERAWLDENPEKLVLFFNTEFPPIEFISESGSFTGMGADIIARIEKLLEVVFIKQACVDWNEHLAALKRGECAIAPTIVKSSEREEYAFFTKPYVSAPVVIITTRMETGRLTLDNFAGRRIGVVSGYVTENYLHDRAASDQFEVVTVPNVQEGLHSVAFGQIDAFVENLAVAAYYIELEGIPTLRVAGGTDYAFAWSIGVSREYPLLYQAISKALESLPESELDDIRKKWITMDLDRSLDPVTLRLIKLSALFILLLLSGLAAISIFLKRCLNQRIADLRRSDANYRRLVENSPAVVYQFKMAPDGSFSFPYIGEGVLDLAGAQPGAIMRDASVFIDNVHPENMETFKAGVMKSATSLTPYHKVFRYMKIDHIVWLEARSTPERMPDGSVVWDGFMLDISDRKRAEKELLHALQEKETLLRELYHRTKNNMQVIDSMLSLQSVYKPDPAVEKVFHDMKARIKTMTMVHQKLCQAKDLSRIDIDEYIRDLSGLLFNMHKVDQDSIKLELDLEKIKVLIDVAVPCGLIINELMTNSIRHAFPEGRSGKIQLQISTAEQGVIEMHYADNGAGVPDGFEPRGSESLGMLIIFTLAEQQLRGKISFDFKHGFACHLRFTNEPFQPRI